MSVPCGTVELPLDGGRIMNPHASDIVGATAMHGAPQRSVVQIGRGFGATMLVALPVSEVFLRIGRALIAQREADLSKLASEGPKGES